MLAQAKEVQDAWRASQRTLDIKVVVDGKTYTATDINSLKYDSGAYTGDTFSIGSTYSNSVQIEFSHLVENLKLGMKILPSIGIKTSNGYVYEPLGVFIIASEIKMDRNNNLTTVSASDKFCGLEGTYTSKLTYPAKVLDVIAEICAMSRVEANVDDLSRLPHQEDLPSPITGQSYRKALGWITQLYAGYATFDRQGLFTIRTIAEPNYELDPSQYEQAGLTKNEAPYKINGIQCQVTTSVKTRDGEDTEETKTLQIGDANGTQIKLENNIMTAARLNAIWEQLKDITFYPFSLNWFGNPAVEAGDWLRLKDKQGNSFVVPNNSYTLDFNGGLSATSKADQTTSSDQMVPWQGSVAQAIKELQVRRAPDGTVIFPPSVSEPPKNAKFNDVWFRKNGNTTELWVFEKQDDGTGKWVRKDLSDGEIRKMVEQAQSDLNQAKVDIITNKQKADTDIENLNKSIEANKKTADNSLQKLSDSITKLQGQYDNNIVPDLTKVTNDVSDALQKYISAQNSIADLTKQAQQQGKNIADVTKTVDGLNINYANLLGDVNSTKVDVKGMQTTLGNASGDIAQLKLDAQNLQTLLAGKVDNATYTNFVNLTNQALNAKLTASDLNGYAKTADLQATANGLKLNIDSVTDRMNNLKIGSRNLLHDTSDQYRTLVNDGAWLQKSTASNVYTSVANYHSGDKFTYTATVTNTSNQPTQLEISLCNQQKAWLHNEQSVSVPVGAKDQRVSITFPITAETWFIQTWLIFQGGKGTAGEKIQVKDERLVFGTVSNTWSPNPEDTEHNLSELSARITATSQQFSSYYTKSETDNRTNSAKNDAINSIKNDGNWQGLSNILTNSGFLQSADGFLQKVQQTLATGGDSINLAEKTNQGITNWMCDPGDGATNLTEININGVRGVRFNNSRKTTSWWVVKYALDLNKYEPNTDYVISFDIRTPIDVELFGSMFDIAGGDSLNGYFTDTSIREFIPANKLTHISVSKHTKNELDKVHYQSLYLNSWNLSRCEWVDFVNFKISRGTIDKGYSPAPSDNVTQIAFSELSQSLEGLRSTVSGNYGQLQSQISQSSSAVRTELNDRINGVDNKTTSTANSLNSVIGRVGSLENLTNIQVVNNAINANDYTNTGNYFIQSTANTNVPGSNWCYLKVEKVNDGRIIQTWQADNDPTLRFVRTKFGDLWTNWQRAASYSEYSELNRTVQGLQSTVSSNYGQLQSLNTQTATAIRNEVNDRVNNLQGQITTQADNINLTIGSTADLSNICRNPDFMDGNANGWEGVGASTGNGMSPSKYYGGIQRRDAYYGRWFPVAAGDKYYFSTYAWQDQSSNNFNLGFVYEKKDGTWNWQSAVSFTPNESFRTKYGSITIPNTVVKARIWVQIDATDNFGAWWFTNVTVKKNNTLAQINMSAGTTLIQNDKVYMDASSTVFSGNAFIPSAAITSLNADKITTGTLNAANVNIINLNANNITAGTLTGSNGQFHLDSGSLHVWQSNHDAWIDQNGIHDYDNSGNNVWISKGAINAYGNSSGAYLYDGGLYLHKSQSLSDAVLNPNYGSITKSDNVVTFGTSGLDIEGKDGFLLRTHGWNDQTLSYMNANPIIGSGISGKSDGFMNIAAKKQIFLYAGEPVQGNGIKSLPHLVLDGTNQNGQTSLNGTFSQYMLQGPSSGFNGGLILQDNFVNVGSLNSKNSLSISSNGASLSVNGKSLLSLGGFFPGVQGDFNVSGNFTVSGSKNAIVPTSRGMAAINAYETAEYYFGDIGEAATNSNGEITIMIDPFFLETVNTIVPYQVFLTAYSNASVWIASRSANCFVVKSSKPNIHFAWEIKAKRKGYENDRMEIVKGVNQNE
ncbi:peptidase [Limosilactobacillus reuteri]|uniref:peptidase n=1 Tax=Limosilactobacillus reuteri TaxID=1598 RepID=UPI001E40BEFA|nr:peptidase [Limosilactobacillus reuteri]